MGALNPQTALLTSPAMSPWMHTYEEAICFLLFSYLTLCKICFPSFDLYSKDTHRGTMLYGGSIIINSLGLYGPLVLSIAMLLRLLFN